MGGFLFGGDGGALRFACGLLALCAAQPLGGAPRPRKTIHSIVFLRGFEPRLNASQTKNHPRVVFVWWG